MLTPAIDTDGDGVPDSRDAFPMDGSETTDTDGDGVGDNADAFPRDATRQHQASRAQFAPDNDGHYRTDGLASLAASDAKHMPVWRDNSRIGVGVDQGNAHIGSLLTVGSRGETSIRHGRLNDGAGRDTVFQYLTEVADSPGIRWKTAPVVSYEGNANAGNVARLVRAVQLVNAALPESHKMRIVSGAPGTGIRVNFSNEAFPDYWGITFNSNNGPGNGITDSAVEISSEYMANGDRQAIILLAHELVHALGMASSYDGHVSRSFDSIMERGREVYSTRQDAPQPLSLLYPVDREALRALYSRFEGTGEGLGDLNDLGPWAGTSLHVTGHGQHAAFGVALRNGYAETWAHGYIPNMALSDNPALSGSARWTGTLLGLTPDAAAVAGDAAIGVDLASMTGRADFTGLETWDANAVPGAAGTGATWLDGDLGYSIAVRGNTFRETGGDAGRLTGIFTGRAHEGAAGTLERRDLTAAFGAAR
ncbi:MAG: hypothetical protein OXQ29_07945 [Rhodospirillaceae bacterium]|nr:hypothetical protein [Rhodospirillaceae bacterium]